MGKKSHSLPEILANIGKTEGPGEIVTGAVILNFRNSEDGYQLQGILADLSCLTTNRQKSRKGGRALTGFPNREHCFPNGGPVFFC